MKGRPSPHAVNLSRRTVMRSAAAGAALGLGARIPAAAAQDATPETVTDVADISTMVGTLFSMVTDNLPEGPVEIALARAVTEPGVGDLEDYFTFPGPFAFVVESGAMTCRCGTEESPCTVFRADGTSEPAPPVPADIPLGPGEGLFIPTNSPDSFIVDGDEPEVELDLSIFPVDGPAATPAG